MRLTDSSPPTPCLSAPCSCDSRLSSCGGGGGSTRGQREGSSCTWELLLPFSQPAQVGKTETTHARTSLVLKVQLRYSEILLSPCYGSRQFESLFVGASWSDKTKKRFMMSAVHLYKFTFL